jgi:hypothetical protein
MKILWVKAGGLVPPDTGGKIRSYNILRDWRVSMPSPSFRFMAPTRMILTHNWNNFLNAS